MDEESVKAEPPARNSEQLIMRPATKADLDSITWIVEGGFPDDPGCSYKYPYRAEYPADFWKWTRREYEEYLDQPEKYVTLVTTAPVSVDGGKTVTHKPVSLAVWDISVETKSNGSDLGIDKRRDANPGHMRVYASTMAYAFEKYFVRYGERQIHLAWLITHPDFRRRGAGTMLCDWGRDMASQRGWMWTVIASPMGMSLYQHLGWNMVGTETIRVQEEDESVDIYIMEERFKPAGWQASVVTPIATLASLSFGALYYIFGRT
ncbi:hypothetical protein N7456_000207 [Penicillium angulare]|uniref:N-acetyltransferase domain-containing protein n=1 Tax=Penicillium angulare TaxID=116970 RepID=A0A9W9GBK3_9EURO|nr:hypothetical protein N7456_000207 [Penicillium angulare]